MSNAMSISAAGMQAASARLDRAASNIVMANSQNPMPSAGTGKGIAPLLAFDPTSLVNLKEAEIDFRASLLAYKASPRMFKTLLDATA